MEKRTATQKLLFMVLATIGVYLLPMEFSWAIWSTDWNELSFVDNLLIGGLKGYLGRIFATIAFLVGIWLWIFERRKGEAFAAFVVMVLIIVWPIIVDSAFDK